MQARCRWWGSFLVVACLLFPPVAAHASDERWTFKDLGDVGSSGATLSDTLDAALIGLNDPNDRDLYRWQAGSGITQLVARKDDILQHFTPPFRDQFQSLDQYAVRIAPNGDIYHAWIAFRFDDNNDQLGWELVALRSVGTNAPVRLLRKTYPQSTGPGTRVAIDATGRVAVSYGERPIGGPHFDVVDINGNQVFREEVPLFQYTFIAPYLSDDGHTLLHRVHVEEDPLVGFHSIVTAYYDGGEIFTSTDFGNLVAMNPDGSVFRFLNNTWPEPGMFGLIGTSFGFGDALTYAHDVCYPSGYRFDPAFPLKNGDYIASCCATGSPVGTATSLRDGPDCVIDKIIAVGDPLFASTVQTILRPDFLKYNSVKNTEPRNSRGDFLFRVELADGRRSLVLAQRNLGVRVEAYEVTQGIQDMLNTVGLVEGKRTIVRVYLKGTDPSFDEGRNIAGVLRGFDAEGDPLPGSPLRMINTDMAGAVVLADLGLFSRESFESSLNFELPSSWTRSSIDIEVELQNATPIYQEGVGRKRLSFAESPAIPLHFVPVTMDRPAGAILPPSPMQLARDAWELQTEFPVSKVQWDVTPGIRFDATLLNDEGDLGLLHDKMLMLWALDDKPAVDLYYGSFDLATNFGGLAQSDDNTRSVASGKYSPDDSATFVHEVGHLLGRPHATSSNLFGFGQCGAFTNFVGIRGACGECTGVENHVPYPDFFTNVFSDLVAAIGPNQDPDAFRIHGYAIDLTETEPRNFNRDQVTEFMSYCDLGRPYLTPWPSMTSYPALRTNIQTRYGSAPLAPVASRRIKPRSGAGAGVLLVRGFIDVRDEGVAFSPLARVIRNHPLPLPGAGQYTLEVLDATNGVLDSLSFDPDDGSEYSLAVQPFLIPITDQPTIRKLVISKDAVELATLSASPAPPTVLLLMPNGGESFAEATIPIAWSGNDLDGDSLTYTLFFSRDGGASWTPVAVDIDAETYDLPRDYLPGTTNALTRVTASDGFWTVSDESDAVFTTASHAPDLSILLGDPDQVIIQGTTPRFEVIAYDIEDGLLTGTNLVWISDMDGAFGDGSSLEAEMGGLSVGTHQIQIIATDSDGLSATSAVPVHVQRFRDIEIRELLHLSNQVNQVEGAADPSLGLVLESSTNLITWAPVATSNPQENTFAMTHSFPTDASSFFYRVSGQDIPPSMGRDPTSAGSYFIGETVFLDVVVAGTPPLSYQWRHNGIDLPGETGASLRLAPIQLSDGGDYSVVVANGAGSVTSAVATLTVEIEPLRFVTNPSGPFLAVPGEALDICCVEARGSPPVSYQWLKAGAPLAGATGTNLVLASVSEGDFGLYAVLASNDYQVITGATFEVRNGLAPRFIEQPPDSISQAAGFTLSICCAEVAGAEPLSFQWRQDGSTIAGATNLVYSKAPAAFADAGLYDLVVSNSFGSATSAVCDVFIYSD